MTLHPIESREQTEARGRRLADEVDALLTTVFAQIDDLAAVVEPLVAKCNQLRAVDTRLGAQITAQSLDVRELVTERLYMRLGVLRPHIPYVSDPSKG